MANDTQTRRAPAKRAAAKKTAPKKAPAKKAAAPKKATSTKAAAPAAPPLPPLPPAGWYLNPADQTEKRYWDGEGYLGDPIAADVDTTDLAPPGTAGEDEEAPSTPKGTIEFRGRTMAVKRPSPEQLAVWRRIANQGLAIAADPNPERPCAECNGDGCETCHHTGKAHTAAIMKLFDRALKIIGSVLVSEADRDWLEDQLLEGDLDLNAAGEIVSLAVSNMVSEKGKVAPKTGPTAQRRPRKR